MDKRFMPEGCELVSNKQEGGDVVILVKRAADQLYFGMRYKKGHPQKLIEAETRAFKAYVDNTRIGGPDFSLGEADLGSMCKVDGEPGYTVCLVDTDKRVYGVEMTVDGKRTEMRKVPFDRVQWDDGRQVA